MQPSPVHWIAVAADRLRSQRRTVAPEQFEEIADTLWQDEGLPDFEPKSAVDRWLQPIEQRSD